MTDLTPAGAMEKRLRDLEQAVEFLANLNGLPTVHGKIAYRAQFTDGVWRSISPDDVRVCLTAGREVQTRTEYATDWHKVERSWDHARAA